jgi:hypothetical protein
LLAILLYAASGFGNKRISADLAFLAKCANTDAKVVDTLAKKFLQDHDFAVINKLQAAKRSNEPSLLLVDLLAVDRRSRGSH